MQGFIFVSFILTIGATRGFYVDLAAIKVSPLFAPFTKYLPLARIEKFYHDFCFDKLDFRFRTKGSIPLMFEELNELNPRELIARDVSFSKTAITASIKDILVKNKNFVGREEFEPVKADLRAYYKDLAKLYVSLRIEPNNLPKNFVTAEILKAAVQNFKAAVNYQFIEVESLVAKLQPHLEAFIRDEVPEYQEFMKFQAKLPLQVLDLLNALVRGLLTPGVSLPTEQSDLATLKTIARLETMARFDSSFKMPEFSIAKYAKNVIFVDIFIKKLDYRGTEHIGLLLQRLFDLFKNSHSTDVMLAGKVLFLDFFMPADFAAPSRAYVRFIMRKYALDRLKATSITGYYTPSMAGHGLFVVDLLYSSLELKKEVLRNQEVSEILGQFREFSKQIDRELVARCPPDSLYGEERSFPTFVR